MYKYKRKRKFNYLMFNLGQKSCETKPSKRAFTLKRGKRYRINDKINSKRALAFKIFRFAFACLILTAFLVMFALSSGFFDKTDEYRDFKSYDNFIWPVVMQDPSPFNEKTPPDIKTVTEASLWDCAMRNKFDESKFDDDGMLVLSYDEVERTAKKLFGDGIYLNGLKDMSGSFYKYNPFKREFTIAPVSGVNGYVPHTVKALRHNDEVFLNVGYVSPKDQFNSEMNKVNPNKVEKFARYKLTKSSETGNFYISAVM